MQNDLLLSFLQGHGSLSYVFKDRFLPKVLEPGKLLTHLSKLCCAKMLNILLHNNLKQIRNNI